jgi:hypothetical protein
MRDKGDDMNAGTRKTAAVTIAVVLVALAVAATARSGTYEKPEATSTLFEGLERGR